MHKHERLLRANSTCLQAQRRLQVDARGGNSETEVCRHRLTSEHSDLHYERDNNSHVIHPGLE